MNFFECYAKLSPLLEYADCCVSPLLVIPAVRQSVCPT